MLPIRGVVQKPAVLNEPAEEPAAGQVEVTFVQIKVNPTPDWHHRHPQVADQRATGKAFLIRHLT
jgi:hypothetical protein